MKQVIEIKTKKDMVNYLEWLKANAIAEDAYAIIDSLDKLEIIKTESRTRLFLKRK